jgi:hypothetical protein
MEGDNKKSEDMITEAEVEEIKIEEEKEEKKEAPKKRKRTDFYIELALFFILGILVGIAVKTEAAKKITIGFNDYKMKIMKQDYDINKLQTDLSSSNATEEVPADEQEAVPQEENGPQAEQGQIDSGDAAPDEIAPDSANPN